MSSIDNKLEQKSRKLSVPKPKPGQTVLLKIEHPSIDVNQSNCTTKKSPISGSSTTKIVNKMANKIATETLLNPVTIPSQITKIQPIEFKTASGIMVQQTMPITAITTNKKIPKVLVNCHTRNSPPPLAPVTLLTNDKSKHSIAPVMLVQPVTATTHSIHSNVLQNYTNSNIVKFPAGITVRKQSSNLVQNTGNLSIIG